MSDLSAPAHPPLAAAIRIAIPPEASHVLACDALKRALWELAKLGLVPLALQIDSRGVGQALLEDLQADGDLCGVPVAPMAQPR